MKQLIAYVLSATLAMSMAVSATPAQAQNAKYSDGVIRIGILNDRSGPYADLSGEGSVIAARMAADEFGNKVNGIPIEIVSADHRNKPDIGAAIARKWYDADHVDVIADITNSAVSLAINGLVKDRKKLVLHNSAAAELSGKACTPHSVQWQYNVYAATSGIVTKQMVDAGMNTFFIIAVDYALGQSISNVFKASVARAGGKIVGEVRHPLNTTDFSSYLLQAQSSGAKAVMLADAGADLATVVTQAREFGLTPKVQLLTGALTSDAVRSAGLNSMQGLMAISWYEMNRNDAAKAWAKRFAAKNGGKLPTEPQASTYSSVRSYLKAIQEAGTDDADVVMAKLREMTINDAFASNGHIRPDGIMAHDMYLVRMKAPAQSSGDGDFANVLHVINGNDANIPLSQSECPLVRK
ncbi:MULTISPECIES: ABC transporter substrate-binding protein [Burkholderia]|uniref:ABC transporter substrate-binding protein n=1 Tax=Burkholderia TaxID=32008 RepID=UPI001ABA38AA|nr:MULTISPECIES: ABC transporter substrate-binding protein [Burkholderia]